MGRSPSTGLLCGLALLSCAPQPSPPTVAAPEPAPAPAPPPAPPARAELVPLEVPGYEPALVVIPPAGTPKPLLVASHGAGDSAAWQCSTWQELVGTRAFVLCPAGVPFSRTRDTGYFFRNHHELEREVLAAVAALERAYGAAVDTSRAVYTGYSQGATMGALMVVDHGAEFSRLVLIEGGHHEWNVPIAKKYRRSGGERVLFACGVRYCKRGADRSAAQLNAAGIPARVEFAEGAGHVYDGAVADRVAASFAWLVEGDARWD